MRRHDPLAIAYDRQRLRERANAVRERVPIKDVVERIVLLKKSGGLSFQGLCPFHAEKTPSFTVYARGTQKIRVGFFVCYGCGEKGDVIAFVMKSQALGYREALELLESENGLRHLQAAGPAPKRPATLQADDRRKLDRAERLWAGAAPIEAGGPVDRYLRGRAIVPPAEYGLGDVAVNAGWPEDLRFEPRCWHDYDRVALPAMLAAIRGYDGTLLTVHRTYLAREGADGWGKARVEKAKLVVGPFGPGFIRLGPVADRMIGGEGVETSLSAMQLWKRPGLAFVNAGRMKSIEPPFGCTDFIYAADKGGNGRWGERFAHEGARAFGRGRAVSVRIPSIAAEKGDFNDLLMLRAASAGAGGSACLQAREPARPPGRDKASNAVREGA